MPLLLDRSEDDWKANKRRKLNSISPSNYPEMAGQESDDRISSWRALGEEKEVEECQVSRRKVGYAGEIMRTSSREELMECIKRGQRPTWVPNASLQALCEQEEALNMQRMKQNTNTVTGSSARESFFTNLNTLDVDKEPYERPRSALHRGDFAEEETGDTWYGPFELPGLAVSSREALPAPSTKQNNTPNIFTRKDGLNKSLTQLNTNVTTRQRAPSLGSSLSSSFVMRTPTSPLVYATSHQELDPFSDEAPNGNNNRNKSRRRTMPPNSFHSFSLSTLEPTPPNFSRPIIPSLSRELSLPATSHKPRGSLTSFTYHPRSNPQTPSPRTRRPSLISDSVHRRKTSMVGSFEESIIRGRMSAPASRPFEFTAQIGVMGKGNCPASLKCPAHVTIPFNAVYYSYSSATNSRSISDDTPSPYVGTIEVRRKLKDVVLASHQKTKTAGNTDHDQDQKIHVGGAYRVPQTGQLQIIIKSQNRTAVKLFLVPYDLAGIQPGMKSFVRQRIFSTGPIIDSALGTTGSSSKYDPLADKHILRYLIHVKFCCPAKGRFYVYDDIRVVFANRVPDGKEKLRSEIQHPEPMFSTWKSFRPEDRPVHAAGITVSPASNPFSFEDHHDVNRTENISFNRLQHTPTQIRHRQEVESYGAYQAYSPLSDIDDRHYCRQEAKVNVLNYSKQLNNEEIDASQESTVSPVTGFSVTPTIRGSPLPWRTSSTGIPNRSFSPTYDAGSSLLSKQLRELQERLSLSLESSKAESD